MAVTSRFSSFVVSFLVSVAMVSVEQQVPVPLSARVLPLVDVDAVIYKTENHQNLVYRKIEWCKGHERGTYLFPLY